MTMFAVLLAALVAASPAPSASPTPSPAPSAAPAFSFSAVMNDYYFSSDHVNATGALDTPTGADRPTRTDISNAIFTWTKNIGKIRYGITAGMYGFSVVGMAINPTTRAGANTDVFSYVPQVYVAWVPSSTWTVTVGKLATLVGQENGFSFLNYNVQHGLVWNAESTFSRGVRLTYAQGKFTGDLEYNDGFYSGSHRAVEGLAGWAPSSSTNLQFVFIVPSRNTPPNPTVGIANKAEYDLMLTQSFGKLTLLPYWLSISSPASSSLGYATTETAVGAVFIGNYAFSPHLSLAGRYEDFRNHSGTSDLSPNADLVGYGPGSRATSLTLTPQYRNGPYVIRPEYSYVNVTRFVPGLAFGSAGTIGSQTRFGVEAGVQF